RVLGALGGCVGTGRAHAVARLARGPGRRPCRGGARAPGRLTPLPPRHRAHLVRCRPGRPDTLTGVKPASSPARSGATTPTPAVVTVTYSPGAYLQQFLESLAGATVLPTRVIMADNGSTDGAPEAAAER